MVNAATAQLLDSLLTSGEIAERLSERLGGDRVPFFQVRNMIRERVELRKLRVAKIGVAWVYKPVIVDIIEKLFIEVYGGPPPPPRPRPKARRKRRARAPT